MFKTIMIVIREDPISEAYYSKVEKSWAQFNLRRFDAITPETLPSDEELEGEINFGKRGKNKRDLTPTEKAAFYSQFLLWKKCAVEKVPLLILEHDAWCASPSAIQFNRDLSVQYFGQHAMEAVMYHPDFAIRLVRGIKSGIPVTGPMLYVDMQLGFFSSMGELMINKQSRNCHPHARYQGKMAPVKSCIDPNYGTTIDHDKSSTLDRLKDDADLFKIVDLKPYVNAIEAGKKFPVIGKLKKTRYE